MSASCLWDTRVRMHHEQSLKAQETFQHSNDFWKPYSDSFRSDPHRIGDRLVERLAKTLTSSSTLIDVGGGGGRLALPLALRAKHVTVVDPSKSMIEVLINTAIESGISNYTVVNSDWQEANVRPASVTLCAHVLYGIEGIVPFVEKLDSSAIDQVIILIYTEAPQKQLSSFWELVHGEERIDLPAMPELLRVLWEMGVFPDVEMLTPELKQIFRSRFEALDTLRQRLYVDPTSYKNSRLEDAATKLLEEVDEGFTIIKAMPRHQAVISWRPTTS